jgi:PAS domain S-box-containing protein
MTVSEKTSEDLVREIRELQVQLAELRETCDKLVADKRIADQQLEGSEARFHILEETEKKFRSIFESVQEVYFEASIDGTLLEVSPSIEKITRGQFTRDEMIGESFIRFYKTPEERDTYVSKLFKHQRVNDYELLLTNKDGSTIPAAVSSVLTFDANGKPEKITGILREITDRKNAENALKETLEKLNQANLNLERRVEERTREILELSGLQKAILDNAPLAILTTDETGLLRSINPAGEKMVGYAADEVVGKLSPIFFQDKEEMVNFCIRTTSINEPTEEEVVSTVRKAILYNSTEWIWTRRSGEKFPVKITHNSIIDANGHLQGYMYLIIDITRERLATESLRKSEAENLAIIQAVPDLMFRIHRDGTYLDSHSHSESSLYVPRELFVGKKVSDVLPPELARQSMQAIGEAFDTGDVVPYEYMLNVNGKDSYFENRIIAISDEEVLSIIRDISDRKESETALKMQSAAFESFALTIIITDARGRIQWVNPAFTDLTGYSVEEAIGRTPGELVGSGKQDAGFYKIFWDTILNKKVWSGEIINRRKDGTLYSEEETITPVLDAQGNISSFIAIKIDITGRKKLYQELADEKRRLADIIRGTNVGTWEWNIQTGETIFNEQWAEMLGYSLEEISPVSIATWERFAHPDDLKRSGELLEQHFNGTLSYYSFESRMKHKNGEWIWVFDRGRVHERDRDGKPLLMSGTHQDITERKKSEEALQWNKSFLELMSNSSPLGFLVVDNRDDEILYFNKRFCQIWEIEHIEERMHRGELKNNDIIPDCLPVLSDVPAFAESCKPLQDEANRVVIEDEIAFTGNRFIRRFSTQIRGANDQYYGRFYIFEDITGRKRTETEIRKSRNEAEKANRAKSEFLSRMSHELRTPMNSILGFAQLLEMGELNPKQKKSISHILNNGNHLLALINEVLDISGIEAGRQILTPEPVQLALMVSEIAENFQVAASKRQVSVVLPDSAENTLCVWADRLRLKQVLINLFSNAIKYNRDGGSVMVEIAFQPADASGHARVRMSISDTGDGIRPEDIGKLFQAFERIGAATTETEGTGLGLMVVKKLTEAMGGKVGVHSKPGVGSTFWIELPPAENKKTINGRVTEAAPIRGEYTTGGKAVLYIEDNLSNIELVQAIMADHRPGIRLVSSIHGKEAVRLARDHKPDLILLDLDLPDIQGSEVLEQLLADSLTKEIPVIIISADAMQFQVEKLMKAGAIDYLTKPLEVVQFLRTIDWYIA